MLKGKAEVKPEWFKEIIIIISSGRMSVCLAEAGVDNSNSQEPRYRSNSTTLHYKFALNTSALNACMKSNR